MPRWQVLNVVSVGDKDSSHAREFWGNLLEDGPASGGKRPEDLLFRAFSIRIRWKHYHDEHSLTGNCGKLG
jgi:hypothetical protein